MYPSPIVKTEQYVKLKIAPPQTWDIYAVVKVRHNQNGLMWLSYPQTDKPNNWTWSLNFENVALWLDGFQNFNFRVSNLVWLFEDVKLTSALFDHFLLLKIKQPKKIQELGMDTVMICLTGMFVILMGVIAVQTAQQKSTPCFARTASAYKTMQSQISAISNQKLQMEFVMIWQILKSVPMMGVSTYTVLQMFMQFGLFIM